LEETEDIEIVKIPVFELGSFLKSGALHGSDTIALLLFAKEKFPKFFS
jgi:hypothetical protein